MKFIFVLLLLSLSQFRLGASELNTRVYQELSDFYFLKKYNLGSIPQLNSLNIRIKNQPELAHYQSLIQKALALSKSNASTQDDCLNITNDSADELYQFLAKKVHSICLSTVPKGIVEQEIKAVDDKKYIRNKFFEYYEKSSVQIKEHKYTSAFYWAEQAFSLAKKVDEERAYMRTQFLAKDFLRYRRFDYAIKLFKMLLEVKSFPEHEELHKFILISHHSAANYNRALRHIEKSKLLDNEKALGSGLLFWIGKIQLKANQKEIAEATFKRLITDHPISFYSTLVINEYFEKSFFEGRTPASIPSIVQLENFDSLNTTHSLTRLDGFVSTKNYLFAEIEVQETLKQYDLAYEAPTSKEFKEKIDKSQFDFLVLQKSLALLEKFDSKLTAFKIIYQFLDKHPQYLHREVFSHLFPVPYMEELKKVDSEIDKNLVLALIRQESAFNKNAVSTAGALGLMQLMPFTAKRMNKSMSVDKLRIPQENIATGIKYLELLLALHDKNPVYTLASYNAGENRVKTWLKEYLHKSDPLTALELIPFKETRMYVKLIYRNYFFYRDLDLGSKTKVDFKFNVI
jgi:soluble lytic murein transglycosylase